MELWLKNGDYVPDGKGGFVQLEGEEALLQRVLFRLCARRGSFPMMSELGSRLYLLGREKAGDRTAAARAWAEEALVQENVAVEELRVDESGEGVLLVHPGLRRGENRVDVTVGV